MKKLKPLRFVTKINTDDGKPVNISTHIGPEIYSHYYEGKDISSDREFIFRELFGDILENLKEIKKTSIALSEMKLTLGANHKTAYLLSEIEFLEKEIQDSLDMPKEQESFSTYVGTATRVNFGYREEPPIFRIDPEAAKILEENFDELV